MLGVQLRGKLFFVFGDDRLILPLVHVDDLGAAVFRALQDSASDRQIYNVVDPEMVGKKLYMQSLVRPLNPKSRIVYLPYPLLNMMVRGQEILLRLLRIKPLLTCYRLESSQTPVLYDSSKLINDLRWQPVVHFDAGAASLVQEINRSQQTEIF
jgi:nucleoside-diphosphate-sugar epimerase